MSRLGFDRMLRNIRQINKEFLREGMKAAQKEFKQNFEFEVNSQTGQLWDNVVRSVPPPILDVTGSMKRAAIASGNVVYLGNSAVLTVDPIDKRGRGYAAYHQEGTSRAPQREFVTQSNELTKEQESILDNLIEKIF